MSRGRLITVLARLDGVDTSDGNTWYEKGVQWAQATGISDAANLNESVTREKLATMFWRDAGHPMSAIDLGRFADSGNIRGFAQEAMCWAVSIRLLEGTDLGLLAPKVLLMALL